MIDVLRENKYFLPFWLGRIISQIGDGIHALAILWFSYHTTKSPTIVGLVMISVSLPGILISPLAGNIADRFDRKKIMFFADISRFISVGILAIISYYNLLNILELILISILMSIASAFFNPTAMALLPQIVKKEHLTKANALSQITGNISLILGPLIGMTLISEIGIGVAFGLNSISFLFSGLLILKVKASIPKILKEKENYFATIKNGFKLLKKYPIVFKMLDKSAVINFFFSSITIVIPVISENIYKSGAKGMGLMMGSFGGGMLISSIILSLKKLRGSTRTKLTLSLFTMGFFVLIFGTIYNIKVTYLSLFLVGASINFTNINLISLYQATLPNEVLGRIMAFLTAISLSLQPISYGVTGIMVGLLGMKLFMAISGIIIMVSAIRIWFIKELGGKHGENIFI